MGIYINPPSRTKEAFLEEHGRPITREEFLSFQHGTDATELPVCLVDNGYFTAAAVAYSPLEAEAFTVLSDNRPKLFFAVEKSHLFTQEESGIPAACASLCDSKH